MSAKISGSAIVLIVVFGLSGCGEDEGDARAPAGAPQLGDQRQSTRAPAPATVQGRGEIESPASPPGPVTPRTPGTTAKDTELKQKPYLDARTVETLPANTPVVILGRQGGWLQVSARGQQGWVRMLHVRTGASPGGRGTAVEDVKAVTGLATGRAGTGNIVATSGIRGLSEEQLRGAKGNPEELKKMEGYGVMKAEAALYARNHGLAAGKRAYLPGPGAE